MPFTTLRVSWLRLKSSIATRIFANISAAAALPPLCLSARRHRFGPITLIARGAQHQGRERAWKALRFLAHQLKGGGILQPAPDDVGQLAFDQAAHTGGRVDIHHNVLDLSRPGDLGDHTARAARRGDLAIDGAAASLQFVDRLLYDLELFLAFLAGGHETGIRQPEGRSVDLENREHGDRLPACALAYAPQRCPAARPAGP